PATRRGPAAAGSGAARRPTAIARPVASVQTRSASTIRSSARRSSRHITQTIPGDKAPPDGGPSWLVPAGSPMLEQVPMVDRPHQYDRDDLLKCSRGDLFGPGN